MEMLNPKIMPSEPVNFLLKPLQADFKALFKALAKGVGHTAAGKWAEIGSDTVETLSAIGLKTEPGELATLLIRQAMTKALFALVGESAAQALAETKFDHESLTENLDFSILNSET